MIIPSLEGGRKLSFLRGGDNVMARNEMRKREREIENDAVQATRKYENDVPGM